MRKYIYYSRALDWCVNRCLVPQRVRYCCTGFVVFLGFFSSSGYTEQNPAASLADQRRIEESWLRLESDRKAYKASQPKSNPDQTRQLDMRLQQQRTRDRQNLSREKQAAGVARQQKRALENTPGYATDHRRGTQRLKADRRHNQLRLQNRMQRYSWPRD